MSPKSLLRSPHAVSPLADFRAGGFSPVIDDPSFEKGERDPGTARRVILCSGKLYYMLQEARDDSAFDDVALVRIEQLHPFPFRELGQVLARYPVDDIVWCQEEPWNMGGWSFVRDRIGQVLRDGAAVRYVGRRESASPATGSFRVHEEEQDEFVREAFAPRRPPPPLTRAVGPAQSPGPDPLQELRARGVDQAREAVQVADDPRIRDQAPADAPVVADQGHGEPLVEEERGQREAGAQPGVEQVERYLGAGDVAHQQV